MLINAKNMKLDKNQKFKSIIVIGLVIMEKLNFKENDNTLKFAKHVSTETSVIFS